jgi:hypothetical protein
VGLRQIIFLSGRLRIREVDFWIFWIFNFIQFAIDWKNNSKAKVEKLFFFIFMSSFAEMSFLTLILTAVEFKEAFFFDRKKVQDALSKIFFFNSKMPCEISLKSFLLQAFLLKTVPQKMID